MDGSPIGIRAAAIDSQSGRDLLTANEAGAEGPSLSFLLNRGLGSFFPEQRMSLSADTYILHGVATGDFNADGRDDIAVAVDDVSTFVQATLLVYLNTGDGFAQPVTYPLNGLAPQCIEAADVTGDGVLDLVVCDSSSNNGNAEGLLTVLAGQSTGGKANGTFQSIFSSAVGSGPTAVASGDIDHDGHGDLLVVDTARVLILYGNGLATRFDAPVDLALVSAPVVALVNAIPGQALPQILVATSDGQLRTFKQTTPRTFASPTSQQIGGFLQAMALADMDDDGYDDFVVVSGFGVDLWYGQADGSFQFGESLTKDNTLDALALSDLNGDGRIDVAASASLKDQVTVVLNGADAPFTPSPTPTITPTAMRTATSTPTVIPTATPRPTGTPGLCVGDCDGNGMVSITELIRGVNIALGSTAVATCPAFDLDGNDQVSINELIAAVNSALNGCLGAVS